MKDQLVAISKEKAGSEDLFGDQSKSVNTSSTGSTVTIEAIDFGAGGGDIDTDDLGGIADVDIGDTLNNFSDALSVHDSGGIRSIYARICI